MAEIKALRAEPVPLRFEKRTYTSSNTAKLAHSLLPGQVPAGDKSVLTNPPKYLAAQFPTAEAAYPSRVDAGIT